MPPSPGKRFNKQHPPRGSELRKKKLKRRTYIREMDSIRCAEFRWALRMGLQPHPMRFGR